MKTLGLLIFDMDGTLIDSMELHAQVFSQILYERFDIPVEVSKTEYLKTAGKPLDEQFKHVILLAKGFNSFEVDERRREGRREEEGKGHILNIK